MVDVMTAREFAELTGCDLEKLEDSIREAESGSITKESMDPSTLNPPRLSPRAEARAREFLRHAGSQAY